MKVLRLSLVIVILGWTVVAGAERYRVAPNYEKETRRLVDQLRVHHIKFKKLLEMRAKVDAWETRLKKTDERLSKEVKQFIADGRKLKDGSMSKADYDAKWTKSGRGKKKDIAIKAFREEIGRYNKFREGYNLLALELSGFLSKRNPKDIEVLMQRMKELMVKLEKAIKAKDYSKAGLIASNSKIASEFGFEKK